MSSPSLKRSLSKPIHLSLAKVPPLDSVDEVEVHQDRRKSCDPTEIVSPHLHLHSLSHMSSTATTTTTTTSGTDVASLRLGISTPAPCAHENYSLTLLSASSTPTSSTTTIIPSTISPSSNRNVSFTPPPKSLLRHHHHHSSSLSPTSPPPITALTPTQQQSHQQSPSPSWRQRRARSNSLGIEVGQAGIDVGVSSPQGLDGIPVLVMRTATTTPPQEEGAPPQHHHHLPSSSSQHAALVPSFCAKRLSDVYKSDEEGDMNEYDLHASPHMRRTLSSSTSGSPWLPSPLPAQHPCLVVDSYIQQQQPSTPNVSALSRASSSSQLPQRSGVAVALHTGHQSADLEGKMPSATLKWWLRRSQASRPGSAAPSLSNSPQKTSKQSRLEVSALQRDGVVPFTGSNSEHSEDDMPQYSSVEEESGDDEFESPGFYGADQLRVGCVHEDRRRRRQGYHLNQQLHERRINMHTSGTSGSSTGDTALDMSISAGLSSIFFSLLSSKLFIFSSSVSWCRCFI